MSKKIGKSVTNTSSRESRRLEAMTLLCGIGSAVETQEARGAAELANSDVLPRDMGERADYEKMGIAFGGDVEGDPLFIYVTLPPGWKKIAGKPDPRHMKLLDERGRERASIFYKAASYDRIARMMPSCRLSYRVIDGDVVETKIGVALDGEIELYRSELYRGGNAWGEASDNAIAWLNCNFPNWVNSTAYWDQDVLAATKG